ncbi:hypothetical protein GCM10028827_24800 [Mucilaginibacter myungsuensis]
MGLTIPDEPKETFINDCSLPKPVPLMVINAPILASLGETLLMVSSVSTSGPGCWVLFEQADNNTAIANK